MTVNIEDERETAISDGMELSDEEREHEFDGYKFTVGDRLYCEQDGEYGYYEGDELTVIGFEFIPPPTNPELAAMFGNTHNGKWTIVAVEEGMDAVSVEPHHVSISEFGR